MRVTFMNHSRKGLEVHKVGCADVARAIKRGEANDPWDENLPDDKPVIDAAVAAMNDNYGWSPGDEDEAPWYPEAIRVMPCVGRK